MKKLIALLLAISILLALSGCGEAHEEDVKVQEDQTEITEPEEDPTCEEEQDLQWSTTDSIRDTAVAKPVIYLYPEEETTVHVQLDFNGNLTSTYPAYDSGWTVTVQPDGTLTDPETGREYYCLFWEGLTNVPYDLSEGFVVAGEDTEEFLEDALRQLGLTDKEANEFIIYWLPRMEANAYNLVAFQTDIYTDNAVLTIDPAPDMLLRVFMAYQPLEAPIRILPQKLETVERTGFTVVEWGGAQIES